MAEDYKLVLNEMAHYYSNSMCINNGRISAPVAVVAIKVLYTASVEWFSNAAAEI